MSPDVMTQQLDAVICVMALGLVIIIASNLPIGDLLSQSARWSLIAVGTMVFVPAAGAAMPDLILSAIVYIVGVCAFLYMAIWKAAPAYAREEQAKEAQLTVTVIDNSRKLPFSDASVRRR